MRVVIPGGSGQVGHVLARHFQAAGHDVTVLSRTPRPEAWRVIAWDAAARELEGCDVCINLSGRSVNCRYHEANRREILESRVKSTSLLGGVIGGLHMPPRVWINASTATIYRHALDRDMDEATGELGGNEPGAPDTWNFSIDVAKAWEDAFFRQATPRTRKVAIRSAMTMSPDRGGVFDVLSGLVRSGLGGAQGQGTQFVSWIHQTDFAARWTGSSRTRSSRASSTYRRPSAAESGVHGDATRGMGRPVRIADRELDGRGRSFFRRTESELILKSRRVIPGRLLDAGFSFLFPKWPEAARDLVRLQHQH